MFDDLSKLIEAVADQSFFLAAVVKGPTKEKPTEWCAAMNGVENQYAPTAAEAVKKLWSKINESSQ